MLLYMRYGTLNLFYTCTFHWLRIVSYLSTNSACDNDIQQPVVRCVIDHWFAVAALWLTILLCSSSSSSRTCTPAASSSIWTTYSKSRSQSAVFMTRP